MVAPLLSIIIPTLNESAQLPGLLADLAGQAEIAKQVIVADGGSSDETQFVAASFGADLSHSPRGRALQMNAAAARATGDYLLFLHADSRLEEPHLLVGAVRALEEEITRAGHDRIAGHFRLRFMRSSAGHDLTYRYIEGKTAFNRAGTISGDQGLLLKRSYFIRLGGFDESLPFLEDQRIAGKIRAGGCWITLPGCLQTSARRFESEGLHRRYILMSMMMGLHSIGEYAFFTRAPGVYHTQQDTGRLLLSPFFGVIAEMMHNDWGPSGTLRVFYRLGGYIRRNSWQMFYFLDTWAQPLLGSRRYPFLRFHDRCFAPLTSFRVLDALTGLFCLVWFMGILAPYFWLSELADSTGQETP